MAVQCFCYYITHLKCSQVYDFLELHLCLLYVSFDFSLICGMSIFSIVFSVLKTSRPEMNQTDILEVLQDSGPASTGLTFIWYLHTHALALVPIFAIAILPPLANFALISPR